MATESRAIARHTDGTPIQVGKWYRRLWRAQRQQLLFLEAVEHAQIQDAEVVIEQRDV